MSTHLGQLAEAEQLRRQALDLCYQLSDRSALVEYTANITFTLLFQGKYIDVLNTAMGRKKFLALLIALPGVALYLLRKGEVEQAIAVWAQAQCQPHVINSQWYKDVVENAIGQATVDLP